MASPGGGGPDEAVGIPVGDGTPYQAGVGEGLEAGPPVPPFAGGGDAVISQLNAWYAVVTQKLDALQRELVGARGQVIVLQTRRFGCDVCRRPVGVLRYERRKSLDVDSHRVHVGDACIGMLQ